MLGMKNSLFAFATLMVILSLIGCHANAPHKSELSVEKQKGIHHFGRIDTLGIPSLLQTNFDWVTLVPWGFQAEYDSPEVGHHHGDSTEIKNRNARLLHAIKLMHDKGIKVFVKPHVWIHGETNGKWRSDIFPNNDADWETWKTTYRDFMIRYAKVAEEGQAEMFCVGTELTRLTLEKSEYWEALIKEIRGIYSGKITYAANWYEEYENITFWEQLDYIGIQAYFPLVQNERPSVEKIAAGWKPHLSKIETIHKKYNRPILFTELGYKATTDSAISPWKWMDDPKDSTFQLSLETQANCYEAFFKTVWNQPWFAGVHLWQWRTDFNGHDGYGGLDFTPQGKPAMEVIAKEFK